MENKKFRDLRPEEIEVRVGNSIKDKQGNVTGFNLLLYKTARTDANVLDETFGIYGWKNSYYQVKNTMVCSISIWDEEKKQWINKDNGGDDETQMEQVKSELSDSMKRAGFNLGIGRKLYTASKIYMVVNVSETNTTKSYYQVKEIEYDDTSITKLVIINKKTKEVVISYPKVFESPKPKQASNEPKDTKKPYSQFDNKNNVTMKELNASVKSMDDYEKEYNDPFSDNEDIKVIKEYYNSLEENKKEQFSAWLFNVVGETDINKLSSEKASRVANTLRKAKGL